MENTLSLSPIGYLRTDQQLKFHARHQPLDTASESHRLELLPGHDYEAALRDLSGFSRIWLVWWFHKNTTWRPLVLPPRGPSQRRGLFATRSPHRPNPLGLTPVRLLRIEGLTLHLGPCDLVDGTPVFDIKPYLPAYDSFPEEKAGWIESVDEAFKAPPRFTVTLAALASEQARWLQEHWSINFLPSLTESLSRDPSPHRTRRIRRRAAGVFEIGCGAWSARFTVENTSVVLTSIDTGYPRRFLEREHNELVPDCAAQLAFLAHWGEGRWEK